ncbi:MAG: hypothetical protein CMH54_10655 [Myxococcales bacterium]|nr:hypothetical protein [Myxococcales bacterium]
MPAVVRTLDRVVRALFEPVLKGSGKRDWRVVNWDGEQGLTLVLERDGDVILVEFEERNDAKDCFVRTNRFNVNARLTFDRDRPLSDRQRHLVEKVVEVVAAREHRLPAEARPDAQRRADLREIVVDRMLMPEGDGQYYLNPYAGCTIGCPFCYVVGRADLSRQLDGQPEIEWGRYVDVKINAAEVLAEEVKRYPPGIVRMSPILTDPYQPAESRYHITRQVLEVFAETDFIPVVLTRAPRILDDLDVLTRCRVAGVGFSIPTDDDGVRKLFEPGADPVDERFEALAKCHEAGLRTFGVVQPMLPMNPASMVEKMGPYIRAVRIDRMHEMERNHPLYQRASLESAADTDFFDRTEAELLAGFQSHGVPTHELDDLSDIMGD